MQEPISKDCKVVASEVERKAVKYNIPEAKEKSITRR